MGFASLGLSGFAPTARFGLLCATGAAAALVSNLLFLPALWVGSVRRIDS
jgi:predicted RND superfamily exporter protein